MAIGKWKIETWQLTDLGFRNHGKRILAVVISPEKLREIRDTQDPGAFEDLSKESRRIRFGVNWSDFDKLDRSRPGQYVSTEWEASVIASTINGEKAPPPKSSKKYKEAPEARPSLRTLPEDWIICMVFRKKSTLSDAKKKIILRIVSPYELSKTQKLIQDDERKSKSHEVRAFLFPNSHDEIARIDWFGPRRHAKSYDEAVTIARDWKTTLRSQSRPSNIFGPNQNLSESEVDGSESPAFESTDSPTSYLESLDIHDSLKSPEAGVENGIHPESQKSPNPEANKQKNLRGESSTGRELSKKRKQAVLLEWASILKRRMDTNG